MTSLYDIIELPGQPGQYARRAIVEAWQRAGSPDVNSALRLKAEQQRAWDAYQNGTGSPADDPNRPDLYPLAHVRGVALDINPTSARVAALQGQGLVRPYSYEPWHWQLPGNVRIYDLVDELPAATDSRPFLTEEDDMLALRITNGSATYLCTLGIGVFRHLLAGDNPERVKNIVRGDDAWTTITLQELPVYLRTYGCDLGIWDVRDGDFAVLNPLDGTVKPGNMWSAVNARSVPA